jgi:hypothetical protein
VPIAVVGNRSNMRSQIQLINQLIGAGEEHYQCRSPPVAADPESSKSGNGDLQHLRDMTPRSA